MALERERCCDIMDTGGKVEDLMASFFTCKLFDVNAVRAVDMFTTLRGKHFSAGNLWGLVVGSLDHLLRDFFEKKKKKNSLHSCIMLLVFDLVGCPKALCTGVDHSFLLPPLSIRHSKDRIEQRRSEAKPEGEAEKRSLQTFSFSFPSHL